MTNVFEHHRRSLFLENRDLGRIGVKGAMVKSYIPFWPHLAVGDAPVIDQQHPREVSLNTA